MILEFSFSNFFIKTTQTHKSRVLSRKVCFFLSTVVFHGIPLQRIVHYLIMPIHLENVLSWIGWNSVT